MASHFAYDNEERAAARLKLNEDILKHIENLHVSKGIDATRAMVTVGVAAVQSATACLGVAFALHPDEITDEDKAEMEKMALLYVQQLAKYRLNKLREKES